MRLETSKIRDEEIDIDKIMCKIRENVKSRKEIEDNLDMKDVAASCSDETQEMLDTTVRIQKDLEYLKANWNIQNSYFICSHRRLVGKALVTGRKLIHEEVRRYVDPLIWKQKELNEKVVRILYDVMKTIEELHSCVIDIRRSINRIQTDVSAQFDEWTSLTQTKLSSEIEVQVRAVVALMNEDIDNRAWLASILEKRINTANDILLESSESQSSDINYFVFEERYRGSRADIKGRQTVFLKYFDGCRKILDIGCGRGEFLEILRDQGVVGLGIDVDEDMINFCRSRGLDVEMIDAMTYLDRLEDKSLDGIFIDQVVEHLEPDYSIRMLGLCYRKLIYGGVIVVETVNPLSFFSLANFYIDMSHKRPVHPETLKFLLGAEGFREIEIHFSAPLSEERRLIGMGLEPGADEKEKRVVDTYNHNISILNDILFGSQDYAVIGKK